ncbi:MAG TPA: hypothetical protein VIX82_10335 [Solirubrobacteraceae bacterium]
MKRLLLLSSGLLLLAFPATGAAAPHSEGVIYSGSVPVRAYKMQLIATTKTAHSGALLQIVLIRGSSTDGQAHYYGFGHGVHVKLAPGGGSGTIKANLGVYGHIDLTFSGGGAGRTTPGCPGALVFQHAGNLTGSFHFATQSGYFRTIDKTNLRGYTASVKKGITCKPRTTKPTHGTELDVISQSISGTPPSTRLISFNVGRDQRGHISESFTVLERPTGQRAPTILHSINRSSLPASAFTGASDVSSAQATASGMFMSGTLTYTSAVRLSPTQSTGSVTGRIVAHFDGRPQVTLPAPPTTFATLTFTP